MPRGRGAEFVRVRLAPLGLFVERLLFEGAALNAAVSPKMARLGLAHTLRAPWRSDPDRHVQLVGSTSSGGVLRASFATLFLLG